MGDLGAAPGDAAAAVFARVGIAGLGLIGGSVALAARRRWPQVEVIGVDRPDIVAAALDRGAIDRGGADIQALLDADLVVLAAPVRQNLQLLERLAPQLSPGTIATDTGSTKRKVVDLGRSLPARTIFIGGHPLAGAAVGGLEHAAADLFDGRPWLFTPIEDHRTAALERLMVFVAGLGARPAVIGVDVHDRLMAFISHLPQLTASALMHAVGSAVGDEGLALAGRGLIDTTRLASSPADIWNDIVATNAEPVGDALDALIAMLQELRDDIGRGDRLSDVFDAAQRWRRALPK